MPQHMGKEAGNFVRACEIIHARLARGPLPSEDRDIIEWSAIELLSKLRPA